MKEKGKESWSETEIWTVFKDRKTAERNLYETTDRQVARRKDIYQDSLGETRKDRREAGLHIRENQGGLGQKGGGGKKFGST